MTWTIQTSTLLGWCWIRNAVIKGWESESEPHVVHVRGFADGTPTATLLSEEMCSDLSKGMTNGWGH